MIERMTRQELTEEAMHKVQKQNQKEAEREAEKAARGSDDEPGHGAGGWTEGISLPRLSLDKFARTGEKKKGEDSSTSQEK